MENLLYHFRAFERDSVVSQAHRAGVGTGTVETAGFGYSSRTGAEVCRFEERQPQRPA